MQIQNLFEQGLFEAFTSTTFKLYHFRSNRLESLN